MPSGTKRDAAQAFEHPTLDTASVQPPQKKSKTSRRRSKQPRSQDDGPNPRKDGNKLKDIAQENIADNVSSIKSKSKNRSQPTHLDNSVTQNGDAGLQEREVATDIESRRPTIKSASSIDGKFIKKKDRGRRARHSKKRDRVEQEDMQDTTAISQALAISTDQLPQSQEAISSTQDATTQPENAPSSSSDWKMIAKVSRQERKQAEKREKKAQRSTQVPKDRDKKPKELKHEKSRRTGRRSSSGKSNRLSGHDWLLSSATGGIFIDHDPVLTPDEQTLILATDREVLIYATKTSLLIRKIYVPERSPIMSYALTPGNNDHMVVGLEDGKIFKYDWTDGSQLWEFKLKHNLKSITATSSESDGDNLLIVYSTDGGKDALSSVSLNGQSEELSRNQMISYPGLHENVRFSADLGIAVVCSSKTAFVGQFEEKFDEPNPTPNLQWTQIPFPSVITCFDAQILPPTTSVKGKKQASNARVNLAVGLDSGEIHLYSDILNQSTSTNIHPRRLHWHRTAPRSVKFSPDSDYLISGGDETVLVIWQLDTNQKQVLPHLMTPILNLSISHQGSAYALRLADNSVMVLSTADLKPFANVNGLALSASHDDLYQPAVLHPVHSDRLLLASSLKTINPNERIRIKSNRSSTMLQTFDTASQIQLGSQALARNLVSTVNIGPNGKPLQEPNVTHLDMSHDGKWLASVDQWSPDARDLDELYLSRGEFTSRHRQNECYLRLWAFNSKHENWELNTRFDEAAIDSEWTKGENYVLAVVFSPIRHQLALADSSHRLKIYSPKARMRSGVPIKDENNNQLFTWTCDHEISLREAESSTTAKYATITCSEDGSVIAVCWVSGDHQAPRVHMIDAKLGIETMSIPGLVTASPSMIGFHRQYLVCVSKRVCIFDTVSAHVLFDLNIAFRYNQSQPIMAINHRTGVLAICVHSDDHSSRLVLFDVQSEPPKAVYNKSIKSGVSVLLADKLQGGFVIADRKGKVSHLSVPAKLQGHTTVSIPKVDSNDVPDGFANIFGGSSRKQVQSIDGIPKGRMAIEGAPRRTLDEVFQFESTAQVPSVKDLFTQVAQAVVGVPV